MPSEGRRAEDFFALKNPTASAGFEHANLGTKGQHATSRPPKLEGVTQKTELKYLAKLKHRNTSSRSILYKLLVFTSTPLMVLQMKFL